MFDFFSTIFPILFIVVLGFIIFRAFMGIKEWSDNNHQPILTTDSKVISKRQHVSNHVHNHNGHFHNHRSTTYYATFEVPSGDRMELRVRAGEYGMLAEGDIGKLTFQGTRYHRFEREIG